MSNLPKLVLVDTNVWLDYCLPMRPGHKTALDMVGSCWRLGTQMLIAATSTKDVFYVAAQTLKRQIAKGGSAVDAGTASAINQIAWDLIENINHVATPLGIDTGDLWLAQRHEAIHGDLEDDLLIAAAQRANVDFIVTNDRQLMIDSPVAAITPMHLLDILGQNA